MVGRLHVDHLDREEVPERRLIGGWWRATPRLVAGDVEVRSPEPPVAQQGVDVGMSRDEPLVGALVVDDRCLVTQPGEGRVGSATNAGFHGIVAELGGGRRPPARPPRREWRAASSTPARC